MIRGKIYDILYKDQPCNDKLDDIEMLLLNTEPAKKEYSKGDDLLFWFIISGIPFLLGLLAGLLL